MKGRGLCNFSLPPITRNQNSNPLTRTCQNKTLINMNPMNSESLVFQVHHPPVMYQKWEWEFKDALSTGVQISKLGGLWMSTRCTSLTQWGVIITPKKWPKIISWAQRQVWLLKIFTPGPEVDFESPELNPDSEVDFMAPPMYRCFFWFPSCRRENPETLSLQAGQGAVARGAFGGSCRLPPRFWHPKCRRRRSGWVGMC